MINRINKQEHLDAINNQQYLSKVASVEKQLDEIFRNGIKEPTQIPYVNQLLKSYYKLTGFDYKLKKENSIV